MVRLGGEVARGHGDKGEMRMRGLVDQRLGGSERLISWPVDKGGEGEAARLIQETIFRSRVSAVGSLVQVFRFGNRFGI